MKYLTIALLAASMSMAAATCPNLCNGHGTCGSSDRCTCFGNWQGADCSERVCSYGLAWADAPTAANTAHWYAECSNKGICDRSTGLCDCFDGYTGKGCRRSVCPNDCSGHGTCYYIEQLSHNSVTDRDVINYDSLQTYTTWDKSKIQACVCDPYYEGADCSLRQCPRGDNVLTTGQGSVTQVINLKSSVAHSADPISGEFTLTFTDLYGGEWTTRPITYATSDFSSTIVSALKSLPNMVIEDVTCSNTQASATDGSAYTCTFSNDHNSGTMNALKINYVGCNRAGCSPKYSGLVNAKDDSNYSFTVDATGLSGGGTVKESAICSEHGVCDSETGLCNCFSGYYDEDCSQQTVLV